MSPAAGDWGFPNEATPPGSGVYYAVRFAPSRLRARHAMLIAWYRRIRAIAQSPPDPGVARLKLDWWHAELGRTFEHDNPQHPLTVAMIGAGLTDAVIDPMRALLDATEQTIRQPVPADVTAFRSDCAASGGRLFELFCRLEPVASYNTARATALGTYWEAVERLCRLPEWPDQVTAALDPRRADTLAAAARRAHCEALLRYPDVGTPIGSEPVPELARRLVAVASGLHRQLVARDYAAGERPVDRAPIAHLWTAWRCRSSL